MPTKNIFSDITLMLLGPRRKLRLRHKIKTTLVDKGYAHENIIIMEDIKDDEKYLDSKFSTILDKQTPKLFFAFFHENERMHGVIFELGWICGKYNRLEISDRLRIVSRLDYDWRLSLYLPIELSFHVCYWMNQKCRQKKYDVCCQKIVMRNPRFNRCHRVFMIGLKRVPIRICFFFFLLIS